MAGSFELRQATVDDAAWVTRLMADCFLAAYGDVADAATIERHVQRTFDVEIVRAELMSGANEFWYAVDASQQPQGFVLLRFGGPWPDGLEDRQLAELRRFYLRPQAIGGGSAAVLMARAQLRASERGASGLFLSVYQKAPRPLRFYEKHGFRRHAAIKFYIDHVEFDDWLMLWRVGADGVG